MNVFCRVLLLASLALPAWAAETQRFYGYAFDLADPTRYLYTEVHTHEVQGDDWQRGRIRYYAPGGELLADKTMDFTAHRYVPDYHLRQPLFDYEEGIRVDGGAALLFRRGVGRAAEKSISLQSDLAADSGFHAFLRDHFGRLTAGETIRFRLAAAGNQDAYRFRVRQDGTADFEGRPAVRLVARLDSLLRLMVGELVLLYEPETRRLLQYSGISNIRVPDAEGAGQSHNVLILYTHEPPPGAPESLPPLE